MQYADLQGKEETPWLVQEALWSPQKHYPIRCHKDSDIIIEIHLPKQRRVEGIYYNNRSSKIAQVVHTLVVVGLEMSWARLTNFRE